MKFVAPIFCCLLVSMLTDAAQITCLVDDIQGQKNFKPDEYAGVWYQVESIPPFWYPDGFPPLENVYGHVYNLNSTHVQASMALTRSDGTCVNFQAGFLVSPCDPAKMRLVSVYTIDFWIVETDYKNYALVYGCAIRALDGTCQQAHAFKQVRTRAMAEDPKILGDLQAAAEAVCLNEEDFVINPLTEDCPLDPLGPFPTPPPEVCA